MKDVCGHCGQSFERHPFGHGKRFCSDACAMKAWNVRNKDHVADYRRERADAEWASLDPVVGHCKACEADLVRQRHAGRQKEFCDTKCARRYKVRTQPEVIRAERLRYREANRKRLSEAQMERDRRNPERTRERLRAWGQTETGRLSTKANAQKRRARERSADGEFTAREFRDLCEMCGNVCVCCLKLAPAVKLTADHIVALINGGSNGIDNIQPLCGTCNAKKGRASTNYLREYALQGFMVYSPSEYGVAA